MYCARLVLAGGKSSLQHVPCSLSPITSHWEKKSFTTVTRWETLRSAGVTSRPSVVESCDENTQSSVTIDIQCNGCFFPFLLCSVQSRLLTFAWVLVHVFIPFHQHTWIAKGVASLLCAWIWNPVDRFCNQSNVDTSDSKMKILCAEPKESHCDKVHRLL